MVKLATYAVSLPLNHDEWRGIAVEEALPKPSEFRCRSISKPKDDGRRRKVRM